MRVVTIRYLDINVREAIEIMDLSPGYCDADLGVIVFRYTSELVEELMLRNIPFEVIYDESLDSIAW